MKNLNFEFFFLFFQNCIIWNGHQKERSYIFSNYKLHKQEYFHGTHRKMENIIKKKQIQVNIISKAPFMEKRTA